MNDFSEIQYGLGHLYKAYGSDDGKRLKKILESLFSGICSEVEKLFDDWTNHLKFDTYLTCVSEHKDEDDAFGRLSMWRAYGGMNGVAPVMKGDPFLSTGDKRRTCLASFGCWREVALGQDFYLLDTATPMRCRRVPITCHPQGGGFDTC